MLPSHAEILRYLDQHPGASDTLEGIVEWWVVDRDLRPTQAEVEAGLNLLVAQRLVIAERSADGRVYYRANSENKPSNNRGGPGNE